MSGTRETVWIRPEEGGRVGDLGLRDFDSFLHFSGGEVVSEVRDRVVFRIEPTPGGPAWFLKVYRRRGANRPIHQMLRGQLPVSLAELEARNHEWLARNEFIAPRVLAWGGRLSPLLSERSSFILTEGLSGMVPLDEWLLKSRAMLPIPDFTAGKRLLLAACGRLLRDLHDRGFHHPFPYLRHFFVPEGAAAGEGTPIIGVIDVDFAEVGKCVAPARRARGLAEALLSSYRSDLTQTDRFRFYRAYCGDGAIDRDLFNRTWRRFRQKLHRHPNRYAWVRDELARIPFPLSLKASPSD